MQMNVQAYVVADGAQEITICIMYHLMEWLISLILPANWDKI